VHATKDADVLMAEPAPKSEVDAEHAQAETEVATNGMYICASCCQLSTH
jgi:hypothetical protein